MADCAVCSKPVVTHWYVRAKPLSGEGEHRFVGLVQEESKIRPLPGSCFGHAPADVSMAITKGFKASEYPLRLLWSPEDASRVRTRSPIRTNKQGLRAAHAGRRDDVPAMVGALLDRDTP